MRRGHRRKNESDRAGWLGAVPAQSRSHRLNPVHADMTWRRADGTTGEYRGPLFELGQGIPRNLPDHGIRRAIFDLAFGYVSGFPVRDILAFAIRSLMPAPILAAFYEEDEHDVQV